VLEPTEIRLPCGGPPSFTVDALTGPVGMETADDPTAANPHERS
jgi:hypothetical protein